MIGRAVHAFQQRAASSTFGAHMLRRGGAPPRCWRCFVVDDGNDRIEVFTETGMFLASGAALGTAVGQFNRPLAVAVDHDGTVLVTDNTPLVQRFACS